MATHRKAPGTHALPSYARARVVASGLVSRAHELATQDGATSLLDATHSTPNTLASVSDDILCDAVMTAIHMRREAMTRAARVAAQLEISRGVTRVCYPRTR